jgi:hypothetical protein
MAGVIQRLRNKTDKSLKGFTMNFQGRVQPVGCINPRQIAMHFVGQSARRGGYAIPVGVLSPATAPILLRFLSD